MAISHGPSSKESCTLVHIVERGLYYNNTSSTSSSSSTSTSSRGEKVTKVLLTPITGRRHQLRLHMKHIGHPIGTHVHVYGCNLIWTPYRYARTYIWI